MNVAMAFQFFGVAHAMEIFENNHEDLKDSKGTQKFCRRMKNLITAMNSRTPIDAMKPGNKAWTDVTEFLEYIRAWEKEAIERGYEFLSDSTCYGLKVSLQAALEICTYLVEDCGFAYVMMARLNQDNLEQFFGMMRNSCGSNEHPDSTLFVQMYRLVSTYSLVKPSKGSNISGADTINVLLSIKDLNNANERRDQWDAQIDTILDRGTNLDVLYDAASLLKEHDYFKCSTSEYVLAYVAGYVTRKGTRFAIFNEEGNRVVCQDCLQSLELPASEAIPENHKLIDIKSRGNLKHPSRKLEELLSILERATVETVSCEELNENTLFSVTKAVDELPPITLVGCDKHKRLLTDSVMRFYLLTRMYFITKQDSKNNNIEQKQTRERRKASKLTYSKDKPKKSNITAKEKTLPVKAANVSKENGSVSASTKACLKRKRSCSKRKPLNDAKSRINVQNM
ncbi:uncharacterized protein [Temnothorax nylanderi]|uniref:uncharacterized protein n=1 Tax=Temnothorax nylanderi TaxID=102681 RepID=UPI003A8734A7